MAATPVNPTLNVTIPANDYTKSLTYAETGFTVNPLTEAIIPIVSTDGFRQVSTSYIIPIKKIIVIVPTQTPAVTGTLRITVTGPSDIDLPLAQGVFIFQPEAVFAATITAVSVSTASTVSIKIEVRIYG
jgi:hypothetical protein